MMTLNSELFTTKEIKEFLDLPKPKEPICTELFKEKPSFLVQNILSPEECKYIINVCEKRGYQKAEDYCHLYINRLNDRLTCDSPFLTKIILERMEQFIPKTLKQEQLCSLDSKLYDRFSDIKLDGLNPRWRFCRYVGKKTGEKHYFGGHSDGSFDFSETHRSFLTIMVYFNNGGDGESIDGAIKEFDGGNTNFLDINEGGRYSTKITYPIQPRAGNCLLFLQREGLLLHEGTPVHSGKKYFMRTDVMYRLTKT